ncbi:hypothetical protein C8J56DRAFT_1158767 [Mycena floridula]|nr:hypothetical protein C8J56DRAFT_1158767 [Mycena floridula]
MQKNENEPLVLHTLPGDKAQEVKPDSLSPTTTAIPRLVSVVEIIKREYIKSLELKFSTRLHGLHQYNEIGCLKEDDTPPTEDAKAAALIVAMQGKHYPKRKQTPFMKITLAHVELPELVAKGATYQPPQTRKLSKGAKNRAKKRKRKADAAETGNNIDVDVDADDDE